MADYEINWLPIETAPRDGTEIFLVYSGSDNTAPIVSIASWIADDNDEGGLWDHYYGQDGERKGRQDNWGWFPLPPAPPEKERWSGDEWAAIVASRVNLGEAARAAVMSENIVRNRSWITSEAHLWNIAKMAANLAAIAAKAAENATFSAAKATAHAAQEKGTP
jgi:hypothetical protein